MGVNKYSKQFEAYFGGEMSGPDRILFEGRAESNPEMKRELDHQSNIVEGLKAHRVAELKARLSSISVEPTLLATLMESSLIKSVSYGVATVAVATGAYFYYGSDARMDYHLDNLESKNIYSFSAKNENVDLKTIEYRYESDAEILDYIDPQPIKVTKKAEVILEKAVAIDNTNQIAFDVPEVNENQHNEEFRGKDVDLKALNKIDKVSGVSDVEKIDIQTIHSRKYNFHYRLEDNRLFLYGKFNVSPYEIIEISSPENKKLFFYYQDNFYRLRKSASTVTPLSQIENTELIKKLETLKNN
jgi:hypothetical protein